RLRSVPFFVRCYPQVTACTTMVVLLSKYLMASWSAVESHLLVDDLKPRYVPNRRGFLFGMNPTLGLIGLGLLGLSAMARRRPPALIPMQISSLCAGTHKEAICLTKGSTARKL